MQFRSKSLLEQFRKDVETAVREGRIGYDESGLLLKFYEDGLSGDTYLEQEPTSSRPESHVQPESGYRV